jgi:hypothetical protein
MAAPVHRWRVYGPLGLLLALSIATSVTLEWMTGSPDQSSAPLPDRQIPLLRQLSEFESALHRHQLAMTRYRVNSMSHERFQQLGRRTAEDMEGHLRTLESVAAFSRIHPSVREDVGSILALTPRFDDVARESSDASSDALVIELDRLTRQVLIDVDVLRRAAEDAADQESLQAIQRIDRIRSLVHGIDLITALSAMFLFFQVRARLIVGRSGRQKTFPARVSP